MEEVRAVLHAIFRGLLKRLDNGELRDAARVRQGKTCRLFHKWNFVGAAKRALLVLWTASESSAPFQGFSTVQRQKAAFYLIGIICVFLVIHDIGLISCYSVHWNRRWRDKTLRSWTDFNP
jgi:hypothetical protein